MNPNPHEEMDVCIDDGVEEGDETDDDRDEDGTESEEESVQPLDPPSTKTAAEASISLCTTLPHPTSDIRDQEILIQGTAPAALIRGTLFILIENFDQRRFPPFPN